VVKRAGFQSSKWRLKEKRHDVVNDGLGICGHFVVRVHREFQQDGKYREEGRQNNTILLTNFLIPKAI
jgi:hypothetical protein